MSKRRNSETLEDEGLLRKRPHLTPNTNTDSTLGSIIAGITPWTSSDIPKDLPPLPPIAKPELETAVFRHPGTGHGPNYEILEWFGDAALETISTDLVMHTFENHLTVGRLSQLREQLVRNVTLAEYYRQYEFHKRTHLPTDMGTMEQLMRTKPRDKDVIKIQGDIFEAYVGAIIRADPVQGRTNAATWLKALWGRTIKDQIIKVERAAASAPKIQVDQPEGDARPPKKEPTPKERLAQILVVKGIKIRYEDMPCNKKDKNLGLPLYAIGVYLDGWGETNKLLGVGTALKKTEAGAKAASAALENRKLMKLLGDKKQAFLSARG
ncbi:RNase III domain-containing protein [Fusarium sp. LHS14.1]|nr:RNase III domain-containing protein [Fusarium sp. LHS14.1]